MTDDKSAAPTLNVDRAEGALRLTFSGDVDLAAADQLSHEVDRLSRGTEPVVLVDLSAVTFIDSTGLRLVLRLKHAAEAREARFLLAGVSVPVRRLLDVTGLQDVFEHAEGFSPSHSTCPVCEAELLVPAVACPRCGSRF